LTVLVPGLTGKSDTADKPAAKRKAMKGAALLDDGVEVVIEEDFGVPRVKKERSTGEKKHEAVESSSGSREDSEDSEDDRVPLKRTYLKDMEVEEMEEMQEDSEDEDAVTVGDWCNGISSSVKAPIDPSLFCMTVGCGMQALWTEENMAPLKDSISPAMGRLFDATNKNLTAKVPTSRMSSTFTDADLTFLNMVCTYVGPDVPAGAP
jgi:hypothetical protein